MKDIYEQDLLARSRNVIPHALTLHKADYFRSCGVLLPVPWTEPPPCHARGRGRRHHLPQPAHGMFLGN
jgi:hypothetical protein